MDKILRERKILDLAKPALVEIYGEFTIVDNQLDNPDAAIELASNKDRIGVEITSVDPENVQQYFRDVRFEKDIIAQQIDLLSQGKYSDKPTKKLSIPIPNSYIFDGIKQKHKKYSQYMESGEYKDIILIAFGEYLEIGNNKNFLSYYYPWTCHLLSEALFPFYKVIYICDRQGDSFLVFDRSLSPPKRPSRNSDIEAGITKISGPILPIGENVNLREICANEPSIKPKKKKSRKSKLKVQKESRRNNR